MKVGAWFLLVVMGCSSSTDESVETPAKTAAELLRPSPTAGPPRLAFSGARPRNLLIISVDALRRDALGRYGGHDDTPFLDARLAEGVALDDFESCANSTPMAFLCLNTGQAPHAWSFDLRDEEAGISGIPTDFVWASTLLRRLGFRAGTVTSSPLMADDIKGYMDSFDDAVHTERNGDVVTNDALKMADIYQNETRPWMLQIHYLDTHAPYDPEEDVLAPLVAGLPPPDPSWTFGNQWLRQLHLQWDQMSPADQVNLRAHVQARYRALARTADSEIARLWAGLEARGLLENTLVLFWSDHGEQLGERGRWTHGMHMNQEELGALGGFWARNLAPGAFEGPTDVTDLLPTVLTALGLADAPEAQAVLSAATGYVVGTAPAERLRILAWNGDGERTLVSLRAGRFALIYDPAGSATFFDMVADMAQHTDLYTPESPDVQATWATLLKVLPLVADDGGKGTPMVSPPGLPTP